MSQSESDFVIIGAGTAGCVVAGRLSETNKCSVSVLEAGPRDRNPFIHIPAGVLYTLRNPTLNWNYPGVASPGLDGRAINHARGRTLGGSGSINGHIYNRGQSADFDHWAQLGNTGWGYADVLPYFAKSESKIGNADAGFHGTDGPFTVTDVDESDKLCDAFIEGAKSLGIPLNPDYNGASQEGINYAQRSVYRGRRVSPARCFLYPAMKRGNTNVVTNAHVQKILVEGGKAVGVIYKMPGDTSTEHVVYARNEVILCAGSIASPHILQLSGIGDATLLQSLGINVVHNLLGVGQNLRDHYAVRSVVRINDSITINDRVRGMAFAKELLKFALSRKGALALTPTLVYCFAKSSPELDASDIQITFTPASYPAGVQSGLDRFPGATIACWQHRPESSGYVKALSADAFDAPEIQGNYLAETHDQKVLIAALRLSRQLLHSEPFKPYVSEELWPGPDLQSDAELLCHAQKTGNTAYHPVGTCRMGPASRSDSVVDDQLRVHGIGALRVADASIMPMIPSANTNASALMIGEKAADMIMSDL